MITELSATWQSSARDGCNPDAAWMHVCSEPDPRLHGYEYARTMGDDAEGVLPGREGMWNGRLII
jgi:hypothetical protein